jgi:hypothetical protein
MPRLDIRQWISFPCHGMLHVMQHRGMLPTPMSHPCLLLLWLCA